MKLPFLLTIIKGSLLISCSAISAQEDQQDYATISTFTLGRNSGHILIVDNISATGPCVIVAYREFHMPGAHSQNVIEHDEHISIPLRSQEIEYISAVNQYGFSVEAIFDWQGKIYEATPCPIEYIAAAPTVLLYEGSYAQPIINTSNRSTVTPENPSITGFVLNSPSWVIIRGMSTSLPDGLNAISDPEISLFSNRGLLDDSISDLENMIHNDDWQTIGSPRIYSLTAYGLSPAGTKESALVTYLKPGTYTVHLSSKGESGTALTEVYLIPYDALPVR